MDRFVRLPELLRVTGISRSEYYRRLQSDPKFPRPVKILGRGIKPIAFAESEIAEYQKARIAERDEHAVSQ